PPSCGYFEKEFGLSRLQTRLDDELIDMVFKSDNTANWRNPTEKMTAFINWSTMMLLNLEQHANLMEKRMAIFLRFHDVWRKIGWSLALVINVYLIVIIGVDGRVAGVFYIVLLALGIVHIVIAVFIFLSYVMKK
ncbi:MAG: hypothetical protein CUN54_10200, partial [Phototrophicales bacterium]